MLRRFLKIRNGESQFLLILLANDSGIDSRKKAKNKGILIVILLESDSTQP